VHRAQEPTRVKTGRPIEKRGHGDQPPLAFRAPALAPRLAQTRLSTEIISFRLRLSSILPPTTALHVFRKSRNSGNPKKRTAGGLGREGLATSASMHPPVCIGRYAEVPKELAAACVRVAQQELRAKLLRPPTMRGPKPILGVRLDPTLTVARS
jgi:hypothetical protein